MALFTSRRQQKNIKVTASGGLLNVDIDGKTQVFPLDWYPQLQHATEEELNDWTLINGGLRFNKLGVDILL